MSWGGRFAVGRTRLRVGVRDCLGVDACDAVACGDGDAGGWGMRWALNASLSVVLRGPVFFAGGCFGGGVEGFAGDVVFCGLED